MRIAIPEQCAIPDEILRLVGDNRLVATILWNRGYRTAGAVCKFIDPPAYIQSDPSDLPGIKKAARIIAQALRDQEQICVYGDYDVDGVTATALLVRALRSAGGKISYHIPNRFTEGYGLSADVIRQIAAGGRQLLVTCDCGISNHEEIALARDLGMKVVVTDHHTPTEKPVPSEASVNPKFLKPEHPLYNLPGVGVAYLLVNVLYSHLGLAVDEDLRQLPALGIVADVVPVTDENRFLLQKGLQALNSPRIYPGLKALLELSSAVEVDEEVIGFQIAPRLNAPGRLAAADLCVDLLLTEDLEEARRIACEIDGLNQRRRLLVDSIMEDLKELAVAGPILEFNRHWHQGVIGIAAGRLKDSFGAPTVLMTLAGDGQTVVGSARSVDGVSIFECLSRVSQHLERFGGHAGAAGFALKQANLSRFQKALREQLSGCMSDRGEESLAVDAVVALNDLTLETHGALRRLAPFGQGNPAPRLLAEKVTVDTCRSIGNARHLRLTLSQGEAVRSAVWWWNREEITAGTRADAVFTLGSNFFNGKTTLQLVIERLDAAVKQETARRLHAFSITDRRYHLGSACDLAFDGATSYFAEGRDGAGKANRYTLHKSDHLVLTTIPPHIKVLREMLSIVQCKSLVLGFPLELLDKDPFIVRLMQALKFAATAQGGVTSLEFLSAFTAALEITVLQGMRLLRQSGHLSWETSGSQVQISLFAGGKISAQSDFYKRMQQAEHETRAFRDFMIKVEPEVLKKLF